MSRGNRYFVVLAVYIYCTTVGICQINITGAVRDNVKGAPLPYSNIIVEDTTTSTILYFDLSDIDGSYSLSIDNSTKHYRLKASLLGYSESTLDLHVHPDTLYTVDFSLSQQNNYLEEIKIKAHRRGILVKGDTITYDKEVFTNGHEQNVQELLNKLPGINVDDQGVLTAHGEPVSDILVNGDDFLNENRNAILKGLSAGDVDNISVLQNYNGDFHSNLNSVAINIDLDPNLNNTVGGSIEGLYGSAGKYEFTSNPYMINRKNKVYFSIKSSNTGQNKLGVQDYIYLNGGELQPNQYIPDVFQDLNFYDRLHISYLSGNFSLKPNNRVQHKGFAFFNFSESVTDRTTTRVSENEDFNLFTVQQRTSSSPFVGFKTHSIFDPSDITRLEIVMRGSFEQSIIRDSLNQEINRDLFSTQEYNQDLYTRIDAELKYHRILSDNSRLDLDVNFRNNRASDTLSITSLGSSLPIARFSDDIDSQLVQDRINRTTSTGAAVRYNFWINQIDFSTEISLSRTNQSVLLSQLAEAPSLRSQSRIINMARISEDVSFSFNRSEIKLSLPLELNRSIFGALNSTRLLFSPELSASYDISSFVSLSADYQRKFENAAFSQPLDIINVRSSSLISLTSFDPLELLSSDAIRLKFKNQNTEQGYFINAHIRYVTRQVPEINNIFEQSFQALFLNRFLFQNAWDAGVFFSKRFYQAPIGFRGYSYWRQYDNPKAFNDVEFTERTVTLFGELTAFTNSKSLLNFEYSFKLGANSFNALSTSFSGRNISNSLQVLLGNAESKYGVRLGYEYVDQNQANTEIDIHNLFGRIQYNLLEGGKLKLQLEFNNLLNLEDFDQLSSGIANNIYVTSRSSSLPGFVIAGVNYRFN